jgi:hypothetical protein
VEDKQVEEAEDVDVEGGQEGTPGEHFVLIIFSSSILFPSKFFKLIPIPILILYPSQTITLLSW